jgi:NAD(P)H dehydrogenase (quinone)
MCQRLRSFPVTPAFCIFTSIAISHAIKKEGKILNCAGSGLCSYTTRDELAFAYSRMILNEDQNNRIFNLGGDAITRKQLAEYLNRTFGTILYYEEISPQAYLELQKKTNGEFHMDSNYLEAAGRQHISWDKYFTSFLKDKAENGL